MIIFLYGPDDYRREAKKREIVAEFRGRRTDLGLGTFDFLDDGSLEKFREYLINQSLFQTAKMAVVSSLFETIDSSFAKTAAGKDFINILKGVLENKNITVLISEKDKPVKALDFLVKKPVFTQEFEVLKGREWESFVRTETKKREINISPDGVRFLAQVYEGDTWRLITELDKIRFLGTPSAGSGSSQEIQIKDLEDLGVEQAPNFWGLILGFKSRDVAARLWALEKVFGTNDPPAKIFNILAYQLPDKLQTLANYDLMVKSGKIEYEEALLDLVIG
ncbi:MAG: hypothetical protein AAB738_03260 [Patescibacteria group bacterium]